MNKKKLLSLLLILVIIPLLIIIPDIPSSYAHAFVIKSNPSPSASLSTPPTTVDAYLNDPIDIHYSKVQVLDSNGREVDNKDYHYIGNDQTTLSVSLPPGLPNGVYTVSTTLLDQTDGHVTRNAFVFAIGQPIPQSANLANLSANNYSDIISIPESVARFPALVGQVIVVGATFASLWIWKPVSRISWLNDAFGKTRLEINKRMVKLLVIGSIVIIGSDFAMIAVEAYSINASLLDAIATKFGQMWTVRVILSAILLGAVLLAYFKQKKSGTALVSKRLVGTIFGLAIAVLTTTSLIGHGAATGKLIPLVFDFIHNMAASLWIGGIIYLDFVILPKLKGTTGTDFPAMILSLIIPRFSTVVLAILGTIAITGPLLLYVLESNLALTLVSIYGKILIIKLSLAAIMIVAGAYHQMVIHKRVLYAISSTKRDTVSHDNNESILSKFGWSVKIESIVGIALIASVAVLVDSGLPATEFQNQLQQLSLIPALATNDNLNQPQVFTETRFAQDGSRTVVSIAPFYAGNNNIQISFLDSNKNPIDIETAKLTFTQADQGIGPITVNANTTSPGEFSINTDTLTIPGHWTLEVEGIQNSANALNIVGIFNNLYVKPQVSQITANIKEFNLPQNDSLPLYPIYDKQRNVVWVGDSKLNSSRIFEFDLIANSFTAHKVDGIDIITMTTMDSRDDTIWYIDPISKLLGHYNPHDNTNQIYKIPSSGILSSIMMDDSSNIWLSIASSNQVLKFDTTGKNFTTVELPAGSTPLGLAFDKLSGKIWVAESGTGKIASIDPANGNQIMEYPNLQNGTLVSPTSLLYDDVTGKIFVSEHDGQAVSSFDPIVKTFTRYVLDPNGLPFGMTFDKNHDLWVAQHTLDKIAVIDPRTGLTNEYDIPTKPSFTQYVTTDSQGDIIMAEERAPAIGILTTSINPTAEPAGNQASTNNPILSIMTSPLDFGTIVGPSIAVALIGVAFFYSKSVIDLKDSENLIRKIADSKTQ